MYEQQPETKFPHGSIRAAVAIHGDDWRGSPTVVIKAPAVEHERDAALMTISENIAQMGGHPAQRALWREYVEQSRHGENGWRS